MLLHDAGSLCQEWKVIITMYIYLSMKVVSIINLCFLNFISSYINCTGYISFKHILCSRISQIRILFYLGIGGWFVGICVVI